MLLANKLTLNLQGSSVALFQLLVLCCNSGISKSLIFDPWTSKLVKSNCQKLAPFKPCHFLSCCSIFYFLFRVVYWFRVYFKPSNISYPLELVRGNFHSRKIDFISLVIAVEIGKLYKSELTNINSASPKA